MGLVFLCEAASPFRDALQRALEASGHRTRSAADASALAALLRAADARPDCVVLDEAAAGGTGGLYTTAVRLRGPSGHGAPPLFAIIARPEPEARAAALQVVDDVVSRPAHLVEVIARIESLLRARGPLIAGGAAQPPGMADRVLEDATTGLRSRAFLDDRIAEEWRRATRYSEPMAFLLVGLLHAEARTPQVERALRDVADALRRALRQIDVLGRYGSTDLAAVLVNTHLAGALTCAERIKKELSPSGGSLGIEIVMGLAFYPGKDVTSAAELVRQSERAMARAREEGPGSICLVQHQGYLFQER